MKYATEDNFLKVYDCAECYLRLKTVVALVEIIKNLLKGYRIKLLIVIVLRYSRMWKIVSNPQYVADPAKGSIHNRGGAVDITLVDAMVQNWIWEPFDFFWEASHGYAKLSEEVKTTGCY
jgi:D-alanyl-D-alanine dipeptidase